MPRYLLSRKSIDEEICIWENLYKQGKQNCSLEMYIAKVQTFWIACELFESGRIDKKEYEEIKKELNKYGEFCSKETISL